jgi:hypothetical protein
MQRGTACVAPALGLALGAGTIVAGGGCQPQHTDIVTEIHAPDGTVTRYVNRSDGYGYNPNITGTATGTAFVDTNGNIASPNWVGGGGWYGGAGWGWGYGYGPCWRGPWGNGFGVPWACGTGSTSVPGAAPIPQNLNVYGYNPGVAWNGAVAPANPGLPIGP